MATNTPDNVKYKQFLDSSERFLQHLAMSYKTKLLHSATNSQGKFPVNKPCSPTQVEEQDTCSFKDDEEVTQEATTITDDISDVVSYITSPKFCTEHKLALLSGLQEKCQGTPDLHQEIITSGLLVHYTEQLLCSYNRAVAYPMCNAATDQDLPFLAALLEFFMPITDMTVHTIKELFINQSDFLMKLLSATLNCSRNLLSTVNKLEKSTARKALAGSLAAMTRTEVVENFESHFGIHVSARNFKLEGVRGILYDPAKKQAHNKETLSTDQSIASDTLSAEEERKMVFNDLILAYMLPPNCAFIYTDSSCKEQILYMSSLLQAEIVTQKRNLNDLNIGAVYGVYSADVTFEQTPSMNVEYIRGQLLAEVSDSAMIWAMDFGVFGFISARNLCPISSQELLMVPPLVTFCVLEGLQKREETFLCVALKLLRIILETSVHTGKSMLLFEGEDKLFLLLQYSKSEIRATLLDLLDCLARNDRDAATFMQEKCFDKAILGKLEYYAHVYAAHLYKCKTALETEIKFMVSMLRAIMEGKRETRSLAESERVIKVVSLFNNTTYYWKDNINSFLSFLNKEVAKERVSRNSYTRRNRDYVEGQRRPWSRIPEEIWSKKMENKDEVYCCRNSNAFKRMENEIPERKQARWGHEAEQSNRSTPEMESFARPRGYNKSYGYGKWEKSGWYKRGYKNYDTNSKTHNERRFQQHFRNIQKTDSRINQEVEERMVNNLRTQNPLQTHFQQRDESYFNLNIRNNTEKSATAVYTDIEDNIKASEEVASDTVDLSANTGLDYVTRGSTVSVHPDETHAFITITNLKDLKEADLAQVVCGLLNSNTEGFLYFGITLSSIVEGIIVRRSDKDMFRNGIDRIMHRCLIPEVRANSYDITFTPVLYKENTTADLRNHHLYIIELRVRPMMHMVYAVYQGRKCYIRRGTDTVEYAVMQKVQDMMAAEDKQIEEYMQTLNLSATNNLEELAAFVKKSISEDQSQV